MISSNAKHRITSSFTKNFNAWLFLLLLCALFPLAPAQDVDLSGLSPLTGFRILGAAPGDRSGTSVSAAGDVNNDGIPDILVGAPRTGTTTDVYAQIGTTYVIFGRSIATQATTPYSNIQLPTSNMAANVGFRIISNDEGNCGYSVSAAGDVNGDGIDDLIAGSPGLNRAFVVFGRNGPGGSTFPSVINGMTMTASVGFRIQGASSIDNCGWSVSAAGDVMVMVLMIS